MGTKTEDLVEERGYRIVQVMFFGKKEVARFATREQAEWRAQELNKWAQRHPRGYVQYLVQPVEGRPKHE